MVIGLSFKNRVFSINIWTSLLNSLGKKEVKIMPVVNIQITPLSKETKKEIIEKATKILSEVTKIPTEAFTVIISEDSPDSIGVGGVQLTEMMKR